MFAIRATNAKHILYYAIDRSIGEPYWSSSQRLAYLFDDCGQAKTLIDNIPVQKNEDLCPHPLLHIALEIDNASPAGRVVFDVVRVELISMFTRTMTGHVTRKV